VIPHVYRDLKSLNVLLAEQVRVPDYTPNCKVSDFGLSQVRQVKAGVVVPETGNSGTQGGLVYTEY
jgi:serine/threonine protein kinase